MAKRDRAVSNTGPILHLFEIQALNALKLFRIHIPEEVGRELKKLTGKHFDTIMLKPKYKDISKMLSNEYFLDVGESEAIALALQEGINLFFTDDIDARELGKKYNLEVHGTLGILLRAYAEGIFTRDEAAEKVIALYKKSSLFITSDLVKWTIDKIKEYSKK